jgi:hypothetical protein
MSVIFTCGWWQVVFRGAAELLQPDRNRLVESSTREERWQLVERVRKAQERHTRSRVRPFRRFFSLADEEHWATLDPWSVALAMVGLVPRPAGSLG